MKNCLELIWARVNLVKAVNVRIRIFFFSFRSFFSFIIIVLATCALGRREKSHSLVMVSV